ncbi:S-adenosylmethionine decarboxylase [Russula compacta]|nr:S-adenosylmethionine decarboxylase [Russula compacta]
MEAATDVFSSFGAPFENPFEGPEKLLEIWFAPSPADVPGASSSSTADDGRRRYGLRKVERSVWEDMLAIVECQILSVVEGTEVDAYLLSESSLFVSPHRLILKTCGTTLNLLGLPRILEIARERASLLTVHRFFYSRKSFFFPERQKGPHREWKDEVEYLDKIFHNGAAYSVGKMNGDHWLLYITRPPGDAPPQTLLPLPLPVCGTADEAIAIPTTNAPGIDSTIEILMTRLSPMVRRAFHFPGTPGGLGSSTPFERAREISSDLGITDLFPPQLTTLDSYAFSPCGYSANALLRCAEGHGPGCGGEGYYTIHVTPEEGWSYASFECNVPLSPTPAPRHSRHSRDMPDLGTLVRRVVDIFRPERLTLTMFTSSAGSDEAAEELGESAIEAVQRAFKVALTSHSSSSSTSQGSGVDCGGRDGVHHYYYTRTDKINYDFGDYDLAFATFELAVP